MTSINTGLNPYAQMGSAYARAAATQPSLANTLNDAETGNPPDKGPHQYSEVERHRPGVEKRGLGDRVGHGTQRFDGENVGKRAIEQTEAAAATPGSRKIRYPHLAVPLLEWIRL